MNRVLDWARRGNSVLLDRSRLTGGEHNDRRLRCAIAVLVGAALHASAPAAWGQNRPFPQETSYPHGFKPTNISSADAKSVYDEWKRQYLKTDCGVGYARVEFNSPTGTTVSEGQGYGMVLTAYFGDKTAFDGLWAFAKKHFNNDGTMGWHVDCATYTKTDGGDGSATDGDLDIAFGLVAAIDQFGEAYRQPAIDFIKTIKEVEFTTCPKTGRVMARDGNWGGGCEFSNSSYWMPGYYRVFYELTGDTFWNDAAKSAYEVYLANRNAKTGFNSNEVDETGAIAKDMNYVDYNGCRTPWRLAADYLWYGTAEAKDMLDKLTDWADSKGISTLVDGYLVDGTPKGSWTESNPFTGGWACGAMAKSQDRVDRFSAHFKACNLDDGYYDTSLRALYMLMLSGNFWKPGMPPSGGNGAGGAGGSSHTQGGVSAVGGSGGVSAVGGSGGASAVGGSGGASAVGRSGGASAVGRSGGASAVGRSGGASAVGGSGGVSAVGGSGGASAVGGSGGASAVGGSGGASAVHGSGGASAVHGSGGASAVGGSAATVSGRAPASGRAGNSGSHDTLGAPTSGETTPTSAEDDGCGCRLEARKNSVSWRLACVVACMLALARRRGAAPRIRRLLSRVRARRD